MTKFLPFLQFFPLSVFVAVARLRGFTDEAWEFAFQLGGIVALLQTVVLLPLLKNKMSRLVAGANLFLIVGGIGFFFHLGPLLEFLGELRAAGVILFVGVVCLLATFMTRTGVFEDGSTALAKKLSFYFLVGVVVAFACSFYFRGDTLLGGILPFVFLIGLKQVLQKRAVAG